MTTHAPSIHTPVHAPHIPGWVLIAATAICGIAVVLAISRAAAPSTTTSTTAETSQQAAAAYQAYRAGERAPLFAAQDAAVAVVETSAYQAYRAGERAPLSP